MFRKLIGRKNKNKSNKFVPEYERTVRKDSWFPDLFNIFGSNNMPNNDSGFSGHSGSFGGAGSDSSWSDSSSSSDCGSGCDSGGSCGCD